MSRAVGQLETMYNTLNLDLWGGQLPTPIITVQSKPGTYGHCSVGKVWKRKAGIYGWNTQGKDNDRLTAYALKKDWNEIRIARNSFSGFRGIAGSGTASSTPTAQSGERRPSSTRKLVCPKCGNSVRATKEVRIMCMDCMEQMREA